MKFSRKNINLFIGLIAALLLSSCTGLLGLKHQIKRGTGGFTEVVDAKPFFQQYEVIGHHAGLILLSGNPLTNIRNTKSIETVFTNNNYLIKSEKEKLLNAVKTANDKARNINISEWQ
ncbi:MAG: hypothetical protein ACI9V1_001247 [Spirosomataceae bacterium]|jgi:hypothetical protein